MLEGLRNCRNMRVAGVHEVWDSPGQVGPCRSGRRIWLLFRVWRDTIRGFLGEKWHDHEWESPPPPTEPLASDMSLGKSLISQSQGTSLDSVINKEIIYRKQRQEPNLQANKHMAGIIIVIAPEFYLGGRIFLPLAYLSNIFVYLIAFLSIYPSICHHHLSSLSLFLYIFYLPLVISDYLDSEDHILLISGSHTKLISVCFIGQKISIY